jgi:hypothetical protein
MTLETYRVFRRKPWRREGGRYVPNGGARKSTIRVGCTLEQARALCEEGPANIARDAGREYRGLAFFEFERES